MTVNCFPSFGIRHDCKKSVNLKIKNGGLNEEDNTNIQNAIMGVRKVECIIMGKGVNQGQ